MENGSPLDANIERMIKEALSAVPSSLSAESQQRRINEIKRISKDDLCLRLLKTGRFDSIIQFQMFLCNQGSAYSGSFEHAPLYDGTIFTIPKLSNSNFEDNLYFNESSKTSGLLCELKNDPTNRKVVIFVSTFYWSVCDFEGNYQEAKIIGKGMENVSKMVKEAKLKYDPNNTIDDYLKFKTRKLSELVGGCTFKVNMRTVYHMNQKKELTSSKIYTYTLVE